jgi:hypothetical protein
MVAIDEEYDRLKAAQKADWKGLPPAVNPVHSATISLGAIPRIGSPDRSEEAPSDYHHKLAAAEESGAFSCERHWRGSRRAAKEKRKPGWSASIQWGMACVRMPSAIS